MPDASLSFDHVHLVSRDPGATAQWYVDQLGGKGVTFNLEPTDINPATRIAFINASDGVSVELLNRKEQL